MCMRVCGRFMTTRFDGNTIEKLPLSATARITSCSGIREHFVFVTTVSFILCLTRNFNTGAPLPRLLVDRVCERILTQLSQKVVSSPGKPGMKRVRKSTTGC